MKKILFALALLFPLTSFAAIAAPWNASSTDKGFISPNAINGNFPSVLIGATSTPASRVPNDLIRAEGNVNDFLDIGIENISTGACATAEFDGLNNLTTLTNHFSAFGQTGGSFTGVGCANTPYTGFGADSTYIVNPNGNMDFALGTTSSNGKYQWFGANGYSSAGVIMTLLASNGFLGLGSTTPDAHLTISNDLTSFATPPLNTTLHFVQNGSNARLVGDTYLTGTSGTNYQGRKANGTNLLPTAAVADNSLVLIGGTGYGTTRFVDGSVGAFIVRAEGTFTDTSAPTYLSLQTTPAGSITAIERVRISSVGNLGVGTTSPWLLLSVGTGNAGKFGISTSTAGCAQFSSFGELYSTGSNCSTGSGSSFPFTPATDYGVNTSATTTALWGQNSIFASSTSATNPAFAASNSGGGPAATFLGNLGVGTTSPVAQFDSEANTNSNFVLGVFRNYSAGSSAVSTFNVSNDIGAQFGLQMYSSTNNLTFTSYATTQALTNFARLRASVAASGLVVGTGGGAPVVFITNDVEVARLTSAGRLGIGSSTPGAVFAVEGQSATNGVLLHNAPIISGGNNNFFIFGVDGTTYAGVSNVLNNFNNNEGLLLKKMSTGVGDYIDVQDSTATSLFKITSGSNVGIGSSTPTAALAVNPVAGQALNEFMVGSTTGGTSFQIDNSGHIFANKTTTSSATQTGYWCYDANGQMIRDTTTCTLSALKFKERIEALPKGALDIVMQSKAVSFFKKSEYLLPGEQQTQHIGFIADWMKNITPDLIVYDSNGDIHGFDYEGYIPYLAQAIQEQQKEIEALSGGIQKYWNWGLLISFFLYVVYNEWDKRRRK